MHDGRIAVNFVHFLLEAINVHPQGPSAIEWACEFLARQVGGDPQARHQGITERTCFERVDRRRRKTTFSGHDRLHRRLPEAGKQVTNRVTISVQTSPKLAESASTPLARPLSENSPFRPNPKVIRPESGWLGRQDSNLRMAVPKTAALPLGYAPTHTETHGIPNAGPGSYMNVENVAPFSTTPPIASPSSPQPLVAQ